MLFPQLRLKWRPDLPKDRRVEVPDFAVGIFTIPGATPSLKLRFGVEVKRASTGMETLPHPSTLLADEKVISTFSRLETQARNQAKAAMKNDFPISGNTVDWILLVGPYWKPITFGPFTGPELDIRGNRPSPEDDWLETTREVRRVAASESDAKPMSELFRLCDQDSFNRLETLLNSTRDQVQVYIDAMAQGMNNILSHGIY